MISNDNSLYMTGQYNVWKVDKDSNILINNNQAGGIPEYRVISFNPSNNLIYVAAQGLQPQSFLNILVLIPKGDLFKFQLNKSVFTIKSENKPSN